MSAIQGVQYKLGLTVLSAHNILYFDKIMLGY